MKRLVIITAVALLVYGAARFIFKTMNEVDDEMQVYVQNLHYNFSARVDSIEILNPKRQRGFLVCDLTKGKLNELTEDSLNRHLVQHKRIRFLFFQPNGHFKIFLWDISKNETGDSVTINSDRNEFKIFRNGETILKREITNSTLYKVNFAFWLRD
jgi:hypothetical protein